MKEDGSVKQQKVEEGVNVSRKGKASEGDEVEGI